MVGKKAEKAAELRYKVVGIGDYLIKARTKYGADGMWENAIAMIWSEYEVVGQVNKKGEMKFVVKV